jgi:transcriptional regulator with XRE-family HTH domain
MTSSDAARRYCSSCGSRLARDNTDTFCALCRKRARDAALRPPTVPPDFWDTDQLNNALASWHMGKVIRAYRHHPFHGPRPLAQELVGSWLGITQAQLSRIEQGRPIQDLDRLTRWAQTLHIPGEYLWFKLPDQRSTTDCTAAVASPSPALTGGGAADGEPSTLPEEAEDVDRAQFLLLAGSTVAGFLASPLVHDWPDRHHLPSLPDLTEVLLDQVRAQTEGFRWLDRKDGATKHLPAAAAHARNLTRLWRVTDDRHPLRCQLAEVAADACRLVAYQAFDQGQRPQAIEWLGRSADLAARADSQDLYVFAVCGVADMHTKSGDAHLALSVLHQLCPLPLSMAARFFIAVYEAHAYASARRLDLALNALDRAMTLSEQTAHEAPSSWLGIPANSFVERQRAIILAQSGEIEALSLLERLDRSSPAAFRRYRVALATDRALTYAHNQHLEPTAQALTCALTLNQHVHSVERAQQILTVRAMLDPYQDSRHVKALDEVIHTTKTRELILGRQREATAPGDPGPAAP